MVFAMPMVSVSVRQVLAARTARFNAHRFALVTVFAHSMESAFVPRATADVTAARSGVLTTAITMAHASTENASVMLAGADASATSTRSALAMVSSSTANASASLVGVMRSAHNASIAPATALAMVTVSYFPSVVPSRSS